MSNFYAQKLYTQSITLIVPSSELTEISLEKAVLETLYCQISLIFIISMKLNFEK